MNLDLEQEQTNINDLNIKQIKQQKNKIKKLFKDMDLKKEPLILNLIDEASFMYTTLNRLKEKINKNGVKELYMNGNNQYGYKDSVEAKTYNAMIKNYILVIKQLNELLPNDCEKINPEDEFDAFNNLK